MDSKPKVRTIDLEPFLAALLLASGAVLLAVGFSAPIRLRSHLRRTAENLPEVLWIHSMEQAVRYLKGAGRELTAYIAGSEGAPSLADAHPPDRDGSLALLRKAQQKLHGVPVTDHPRLRAIYDRIAAVHADLSRRKEGMSPTHYSLQRIDISQLAEQLQDEVSTLSTAVPQEYFELRKRLRRRYKRLVPWGVVLFSMGILSAACAIQGAMQRRRIMRRRAEIRARRTQVQGGTILLPDEGPDRAAQPRNRVSR
jgi:hypothetical protein